MKKLLLVLLFVPLVCFSQERHSIDELMSSSEECKSVFVDSVNYFNAEIGNCSSNIDFYYEEIPFAVVESVPRFLQCYLVDNSEARKCFQEQINAHIRRNFRYPKITKEMGVEGRVYLSFIISECGIIENIRQRGPDKNLEKEAHRIISLLPQMTPGKQKGRAVRVPFSIPITFKLN